MTTKNLKSLWLSFLILLMVFELAYYLAILTNYSKIKMLSSRHGLYELLQTFWVNWPFALSFSLVTFFILLGCSYRKNGTKFLTCCLLGGVIWVAWSLSVQEKYPALFNLFKKYHLDKEFFTFVKVLQTVQVSLIVVWSLWALVSLSLLKRYREERQQERKIFIKRILLASTISELESIYQSCIVENPEAGAVLKEIYTARQSQLATST